MAGYIGKISALVTASTADLERKLQGAKGQVNSFGSSLNRTITTASKSAQASLNDIFTPLQRIQRALSVGSNSRLGLVTPQQVEIIQRAVSVAGEINKPLASARKQFESLGQSVQAAFLPALDLAQRRVAGLNDLLERSGSVSERAFAAVAARVERTTQAVQRLSEAQRIAAEGFTGRELRFTSPQVFSTLKSLSAAQQQAGELPAAKIQDSAIAQQVQRLQTFKDGIVRTQAEIERLRLAPQVDSAALSAAENRLKNIIATAVKSKQELDRVVSATTQFQLLSQKAQVGGLGLFGAVSGTDAERAIARARSLSEEYAKLPVQAQQGLAGVAGIASRVADGVSAGTSNAQALMQILDSLEPKIQQAARSALKLAESTALIVRPADADVQVSATAETLTGDYRKRLAAQESDIRSRLGRGIDDPLRQLGTIEGGITSLKSQLDILPASVRDKFIPSLKSAEDELIRLSLSPGRTKDEIERLSASVLSLRADVQGAAASMKALDQRASSGSEFLRAFGGAGREGIGVGIDARSLQSVGAEIEFVQKRLSALNSDVRGPVIAALQAFRERAASLFQGGKIDTTKGRQQLELLRQQVIRTLSAAGGGSESRIEQQLKRVGDIGRGGFDKYSLAVQQAAFAIDDFLSVQGDLSQRIRAVQNNVTQLAFILGGTTGLFVGLGVAIAGQVIVGLIKFINKGVEAEDKTKALNDALAKQKSLVEDLRQAFESLGDAIARRAFSGPAQRAREFGKQLDEISRKQKDLQETRTTAIDRGVQAERALQNSLQRRLEASTDPSRRVVLQQQINESRRREREDTRRATERGVSGEDVQAAVRNAIVRFREGTPRITEAFVAAQTGRESASAAIQQAAAAAAAAIPLDATVNARLAQLQSLRAAAAEAPANAGSPMMFFGTLGPPNAAGENVLQLEELSVAIENELDAAISALADTISRSSVAAAAEIELAQADVADAIKRGVQGAGQFQGWLDSLGDILDAAQERLTRAQAIGDPEARVREVENARRDVDAVLASIEAGNARAREIRLGREIGGERATAALSAISGDRFGNEASRLRANLQSTIDAEEQARRSRDVAIEKGDAAAIKRAEADLAAAQAASELAASAAEAAVSLEDSIARQREAIGMAVVNAGQLAQDARNRLDSFDPTVPGATPRDQLIADRDAAEQFLRERREQEAMLSRRLDSQRVSAQSDQIIQRINDDIERLRSEGADAAARARITNEPEPLDQIRRRDSMISGLEKERQARIDVLTRSTVEAADAENELVSARRLTIAETQRQRDFEAEVVSRRSPRGDAIRGLDLLERPGQQAARELTQSIADINKAFERQQAAAGAGDIGPLVQQRDDAIRRAVGDTFRATAPAIFALADAATNIEPSRASLQASDIATAEGARELNRLLRGDDPAKDANLEELRVQSRYLQELVQLARDNNIPIADR